MVEMLLLLTSVMSEALWCSSLPWLPNKPVRALVNAGLKFLVGERT